MLLCAVHLRSKGLSEATALWLGSNLVPDAHGKLGWAFRTQGATAMYQSYRYVCVGVTKLVGQACGKSGISSLRVEGLIMYVPCAVY